jgi:hypothetical protein
MIVQAPINEWQVNRLALQWLQQVGEAPEPMAAYVPRLAAWAIRMGHFRAGKPLAPSHPLQEDVEETAEALEAMVGPTANDQRNEPATGAGPNHLQPHGVVRELHVLLIGRPFGRAHHPSADSDEAGRSAAVSAA